MLQTKNAIFILNKLQLKKDKISKLLKNNLKAFLVNMVPLVVHSLNWMIKLVNHLDSFVLKNTKVLLKPSKILMTQIL